MSQDTVFVGTKLEKTSFSVKSNEGSTADESKMEKIRDKPNVFSLEKI